MDQPFDSFVILAEMRTGSNFLESNVNGIDGLHCYGEAFNPQFIGQQGVSELFGVSLEAREGDPDRLLQALADNTEGLSGFRFFNDHDPRVFDAVLENPRCAKIVLTRNPLDSYVSLKIASETGQWKLTDMKHRKATRVKFNTTEFEAHLDRLHQFQVRLLNRLQVSGQSAFYLAYEDIGDVDVLNGLAAWLGVEGRLEHVSGQLKKQNPAPISEKVVNYDAMVEAMARLDRFDLTRTPNFEPRRGPSVPGFIAAPDTGLLFMPIQGGPVPEVEGWLSALDEGRAPLTNFTQKSLRQWKRRNRLHRAFTVVSHPVDRAYRAYCILLTDDSEKRRALRGTLRRAYHLPLPNSIDEDKDHKRGFLAFLKFLKGNLARQTSVRIDPAWASQHAVIQGMAQFHLPDMIVRAERLDQDLAGLAAVVGRSEVPKVPAPGPLVPFTLADVYDDDIEDAARDAYQRDYMTFGYGRWDKL